MVLGGLSGLAAGGGSSAAAAARFDHPPPLNNSRHQFEMLAPPRRLPTIPLTGLDGRPEMLAPTPGRVLLVNIWATWCEQCRTELPLLDRFQEAAPPNVAIVAVSTDKLPPARVKAFLAALRIRHLRILLDPDERAASAAREGEAPLRIYGMPVTYLITPAGRIAGDLQGATDWLASDSQRLLAYYANATE